MNLKLLLTNFLFFPVSWGQEKQSMIFSKQLHTGAVGGGVARGSPQVAASGTNECSIRHPGAVGVHPVGYSNQLTQAKPH